MPFAMKIVGCWWLVLATREITTADGSKETSNATVDDREKEKKARMGGWVTSDPSMLEEEKELEGETREQTDSRRAKSANRKKEPFKVARSLPPLTGQPAPPPCSLSATSTVASNKHESTRAHAPWAISNPLAPTRAQLQKPNPPPDHFTSPSTFNFPHHFTNAQRTSALAVSIFFKTNQNFHLSTQSVNMPPKVADKKVASKAPATASKAPEKKDAGKKTAASGDKKKRSKTRKETYSSYIYKGESYLFSATFRVSWNASLIHF